MSRWSILSHLMPTALWLSLGSEALSAADAPAKADPPKPFFVQTAYLPEAVGKAHRISLSGVLSGKGAVVFDGNACTGVDLFGDVGACTMMFIKPIPVEFRQLRLADPTGKHRRVFRLEGKTEPPGVRYYITMPSEANAKDGPWRLIVEKSDKDRCAITLEPADAAAKPVSRIVGVQCAIEKSNPPNLVVSATGEVPTLGWKNPALTRVVYVQFPPDGIWDYTFTAIPPTGPVPQQVAPVQATDRWSGYPWDKLKGIRVHCANGPAWEVRFGK